MSATTTTDAAATGPGTRDLSGLRWFNLVTGLLHLVQGVGLVALSNDLALPVSATFLTADPVTVRGPIEPSLVDTFPIGPAVAAFVFLAAADHLLAAGPLWGWYERMIRARRNDLRWLEYSVSASLMIVLIALFAGVWDLGALLAIFGVNAAMIGFGFLVERDQEPGADADLSAFWLGTLAGLVPWAIIVVFFVGAGGEVPGFVYGIFVSLFVFFSSFAVNQWLQYRQVGPWRDYVFGERGYIVLSLVAKSALAWQIFGNVLRS